MNRRAAWSPLWLSGIVLSLGWGAAAFGAPYQWAYVPLLVASAVLGLIGIYFGRRRVDRALVLGFAAIGLAIVMQIVPLPMAWVETLNPQAVALLREQDLRFSIDSPAAHALSIGPSRTALGLAFFSCFGLLLLGTARALNRERARVLARAIVVIGVLVAAAGIVQRATFNGKIYGFWEPLQASSPFGPFVNRNHFAGWMLMGLSASLGLFYADVSRATRSVSPRRRSRLLQLTSIEGSQAIFTGFAVVVMALALVLSDSRSGIIALAVTLGVTSIAIVRREHAAHRRALVLGYLAATTIGVLWWVGPGDVYVRFAQTGSVDMADRFSIWDDTLKIASDFWLTGTGLNTYGISTLHYQTALPGQHLREAHNDYLQLAAEGGLLLAVPITVTAAIFCLDVRRRLREDLGSIWWIRMGAVAGLLAVAVQSVAEFSLQMPGNAALFSVLGGVALHDGRRESHP